MPGSKVTRSALFSFRTPEQRIPAAHRLLESRVPIDGVVVSLHWGLERLYEKDALLGYEVESFGRVTSKSSNVSMVSLCASGSTV
jgi:hypothetical protein